MTRLPKADNRTAIIGSTGSGKTQFSVWLLSTRDFDKRPWIIFDFKGDELLDQLGARNLSLNSFPSEPGLYIVRPLPGDDDLINEFFFKCWSREYIGIYIDEGYMLPKFSVRHKWFRACLTQGRSKQIEMIICSQRPVFLDKFVWTESNFFAIFNMNYAEDRKHVSAYLDNRKPSLLPRYNCLWYDVAKQASTLFSPVPKAQELLKVFQKRLEKKTAKI